MKSTNFKRVLVLSHVIINIIIILIVIKSSTLEPTSLSDIESQSYNIAVYFIWFSCINIILSVYWLIKGKSKWRWFLLPFVICNLIVVLILVLIIIADGPSNLQF